MVRTGPAAYRGRAQAVVVSSRLPSRLRATRVAAAAPNSRIIGGAGTLVPPVELDEPPLDEELELDELELLLDEEELLPELPKLLEPPVAPELVDVLVAPELVEVLVAPELVDVLVAPELVAPELLEVELCPPEDEEDEPFWF